MRYLWKYLKAWRLKIMLGMGLKLSATLLELLIPYVMEHLLDHVVPRGETAPVLLWGGAMILLACCVRFVNVTANRMAVLIAKENILRIRRDLFHASLNLSGGQMDTVGLPSLISRMTSDTYNVQNFIRAVQTLGIRAPIMLVGGIAITLTMDTGLAMILCIMAPIMIALVVFVSSKGIPLYDRVQQGMDSLVRIMRENITGIRVVKALSKEPYEMRRFGGANSETARRDIKASVTMALPGPIVTLFLNIGLTLVVLIGARRVNDGATQPGVILAFLTYFNMILMGVMGLNRVFMMLSKANASAARIAAVAEMPEDLPVLPEAEGAVCDREGYLVFDHVSFSYPAGERAEKADAKAFAGGARQRCLKDIDFSVRRGGSLGIIGATGSGKTTIINLLMRFYDADEGHVFVDGRDVRTWDPDELRRRFGAVFQNDAIFADTIRENVTFGRDVDEAGLRQALEDAQAADFVYGYGDGADHEAAIHGGNFSGGQKQRLLIARALADRPSILILDDASSALDYRTDAELRRAIREHHADATLIVIAQRVSSIMGLDEIIVLDEGEMIGRGTHEKLLRTCPVYREIRDTQMGEVE
ncbi:MAG: ABC transporter ATP-binding protein [Clostridia bacterium]|nr:ABC transporter ATP-binding protein [Clostridia bacterium]